MVGSVFSSVDDFSVVDDDVVAVAAGVVVAVAAGVVVAVVLDVTDVGDGLMVS